MKQRNYRQCRTTRFLKMSYAEKIHSVVMIVDHDVVKNVTLSINMMVLMLLCNSVVLKKSGMFLELQFPSHSTTIHILYS
jgi:hypothetical protein